MNRNKTLQAILKLLGNIGIKSYEAFIESYIDIIIILVVNGLLKFWSTVCVTKSHNPGKIYNLMGKEIKNMTSISAKMHDFDSCQTRVKISVNSVSEKSYGPIKTRNSSFEIGNWYISRHFTWKYFL